MRDLISATIERAYPLDTSLISHNDTDNTLFNFSVDCIYQLWTERVEKITDANKAIPFESRKPDDYYDANFLGRNPDYLAQIAEEEAHAARTGRLNAQIRYLRS